MYYNSNRDKYAYLEQVHDIYKPRPCLALVRRSLPTLELLLARFSLSSNFLFTFLIH